MQDSPFAALAGHKYINLTTFRRDGTPVTTPVWFAQDGDTLYVMTMASAGKVKRIRNNGQVEIAPASVSGAPLGPAVGGVARVLPPGPEAQRADRALNAKYGLIKRAFDLFGRMRGGNRVYLAITPRPMGVEATRQASIAAGAG
jgi:PPOX class probable F420-dependent enzyme